MSHEEDGGFTHPLGSSILPKLRSQHPFTGTRMSHLISDLLLARVGLGRLSQKSCSCQQPPPLKGSENLAGWAAQGEATISSSTARAINMESDATREKMQICP